MTDDTATDEDKLKYRTYETGQAWLYLQKRALLKATEPTESTGIWAKVAMECERKFKECQNELRRLLRKSKKENREPSVRAEVHRGNKAEGECKEGFAKVRENFQGENKAPQVGQDRCRKKKQQGQMRQIPRKEQGKRRIHPS